jgi:hypothetical protein
MSVGMLEDTEASPENLDLPESKHDVVLVEYRHTIIAPGIIESTNHGRK